MLINIYLWFLAIVSRWPRKASGIEYSRWNEFIVIVPAHNEAQVIERTLTSLKNLDYPRNKYKVIVAADNCSDNTAQIVRDNGVVCLERRDTSRLGKGFVLQWALDKLKTEAYDAVAIIDADTVAEAGFLRAMNQRLNEGEKAVQGYYDVLNPEASPMASLSCLGFVLSRNLRYAGRSRLGWSANLLGNGMCFSRQVIADFGWSATSIVEDVEYAVTLVLHGLRVAFAPEAKVYAEIPASFKDSRAQRARWDLGKFRIRNKYLTRLIKAGLFKRKWICLDSALELLIPPYSLFCMSALMLFLLAAVISWGESNLLFFLWLGNIVSIFLYSLLGLIIAKAGWGIYKNLLYAPFFLIWRFKTVVQGYFSRAGTVWIKTQR